MKKHYNHTVFLTALVIWAAIMLYAGYAHSDSLDESRNVVSETNNKLKGTQDKINKLDDATKSMLDKYKAVVSESETYITYNQQLEAIVQSQKTDIESLERQIEEIEVTSREVMPLMAQMIETLSQFIDQDLPFLPHERTERVARLRDNMIKADITVAEKYRKILEAYQIEIEYGKTLEAYTDDLDGRQVDFVRIGRTALLYQSLDQTMHGVWNKHAQNWQLIEDGEVKQSIDNAIKVARKQKSPELLTILASKIEE